MAWLVRVRRGSEGALRLSQDAAWLSQGVAWISQDAEWLCGIAQLGCGVAQQGEMWLRQYLLAVRRAQVRITAQHPRGGFLPIPFSV